MEDKGIVDVCFSFTDAFINTLLLCPVIPPALEAPLEPRAVSDRLSRRCHIKGGHRTEDMVQWRFSFLTPCLKKV